MSLEICRDRCTGAPSPAVITDERHLYVVYVIEELDSSWSGDSVRVVTPESDDEAIRGCAVLTAECAFLGSTE